MNESPSSNRHTFVLRIWREPEAANAKEAWRGYIQHVRSGRESYVLTMDEIMAFLEEYAGRLQRGGEARRPKK